MREEERDSKPSSELAQSGHPLIGLRFDPVCAERIGKGIAADREFGSEDPCGACLCCADNGGFDRTTILDEISWHRGQMQEGDAQRRSGHGVSLYPGRTLAQILADSRRGFPD